MSDPCIIGKLRSDEECNINSKKPIKIYTISEHDLNILSRVDGFEKMLHIAFVHIIIKNIFKMMNYITREGLRLNLQQILPL